MTYTHLTQTQIVCTALLFIWIATVIAWERIAPYRKGVPFFREGLWVDLFWYTLVQSLFLTIIISGYVIKPAENFLNAHFNWSASSIVHGFQRWSTTAQVIFFVVTHDLYIYLFHRWQHANKWLWRLHEAHHSDKEVDFLAGSRSHALEILINQSIEYAPIILLGAPPEVAVIKGLIDAVYGTFIHANVDVRFGKLKYFFNTPELHLWHHANTLEVFHANFATKLSVWDYLFGTVYYPAHKPGDKPENWGLYYDFPKDYFLQHAFSFRRFDEKKLLRYKWFARYYYLRPNLMKWAGGILRIKPAKPDVPEPVLTDARRPEEERSYQAAPIIHH